MDNRTTVAKERADSETFQKALWFARNIKDLEPGRRAVR